MAYSVEELNLIMGNDDLKQVYTELLGVKLKTELVAGKLQLLELENYDQKKESDKYVSKDIQF